MDNLKIWCLLSRPTRGNIRLFARSPLHTLPVHLVRCTNVAVNMTAHRRTTSLLLPQLPARPLSILCAAVYTDIWRLTAYLQMPSMAFEKNRSCETQLIITIQDLAKTVDNKGQTDVILLYFLKAFDKVPHHRLLHKLEFYSIRGSLHNWISRYLGNRSQQVLGLLHHLLQSSRGAPGKRSRTRVVPFCS